MTPDLPTTERTADVEAWRARMEAKGERARGFLAREAKAVESQTGMPRRGTRAKPRAGGSETGRPRGATPLVIEPCTSCGRMTRSGATPEHRAPGTVQRAAKGMCTTCHRKGRKS